MNTIKRFLFGMSRHSRLGRMDDCKHHPVSILWLLLFLIGLCTMHLMLPVEMLISLWNCSTPSGLGPAAEEGTE